MANSSSILKQLQYSFLGFGLLMGIVFPFYANIFVNWKEGMLVWFCLGCIVAGITIGIVNHKLLEILLIRKLRLVAVAADRIRKGDLREGCGVRSSERHSLHANHLCGFCRRQQRLNAICRRQNPQR